MTLGFIHVKKMILSQELVTSSLMVREYTAAYPSANALSQHHELGKNNMLFLGSKATSELYVLKESHEGHYTKPLATYS